MQSNSLVGDWFLLHEFLYVVLRSSWLLQFNLKATVMHVEVRDYTLFCLAQVTSMTQTATLVGFLGGWFVIYSSSSTITALGLRSLLPTTPPALKKFLDRFDPDVVTEHSVMERWEFTAIKSYYRAFSKWSYFVHRHSCRRISLMTLGKHTDCRALVENLVYIRIMNHWWVPFHHLLSYCLTLFCRITWGFMNFLFKGNVNRRWTSW